MALGQDYGALMGNDQKLIDQVKKAGEITAERLWQLPLGPEFTKLVKSQHADIQNIAAKRFAGSSIGGDISIKTDLLLLTGGASISAKSSATGDAGTIFIDASDTVRLKNSVLTTESENADGGNVTVYARYMLYLDGSELTAAVGGGPETIGETSSSTLFMSF